ncbi:MAG: isoprenyl transferase [Candidatus Omnitrophica bacterium]|nr:isoprenyl transferase [Candidatus Omnitrophota bacterium]
MIDKADLPRHIAIIMDGNGRWAKIHNLPKIAGHRKGVEAVREAVTYCRAEGIQVLTVYAFSTENWNRPKKEVGALMALLGEEISKETDNLKKNDVRLSFIGRIDDLPGPLLKRIRESEDRTKACKGLIFNLAINYGARSEIIDAVNKILSGPKKEIKEEEFSSFLYTKGLPDPDLLIRTSGEMRISNFLLWQASYAEFYFTEKLWPDFTKADLKEAIETYQKRSRRFGK